ncbi:hypothetical protein [Leptothrix discophora]|uniref:Uncharacterized protein n=1 Tax=Leptothrix discophora TaxID=89 RepID=A0ABT9G181_LEPDI|nr:hypothetical protein [Leptothrix discophora]MDP4300216.1 hypothetical protein [Leptothrix discophora]
MTLHVYQDDTKIVLVSRISVADWRNELRHFELSEETATCLLALLPPEDNELGLSGDQLLGLLRGTNETATFVKMSMAEGKVQRTLTALAKVAWEREAIYSVDETEAAKGDEYFVEYKTVYTVVNGSVE